MATRALPGETRRPSVEAPLHNLFPQRLVLHVHPALINGLTCSREGEAACRRLFGDQVLWVPFCRPGYVLASLCREAMARHKARTGRLPQICLLQENHGIFVAGDTPEEIDGLYAWVRDTLAKEVRQVPDLTPAGREDPELTRRLKARCQMEYTAFSGGRDILALARSPQAAAPVLGAFTQTISSITGLRPLIWKVRRTWLPWSKYPPVVGWCWWGGAVPMPWAIPKRQPIPQPCSSRTR